MTEVEIYRSPVDGGLVVKARIPERDLVMAATYGKDCVPHFVNKSIADALLKLLHGFDDDNHRLVDPRTENE